MPPKGTTLANPEPAAHRATTVRKPTARSRVSNGKEILAGIVDSAIPGRT